MLCSLVCVFVSGVLSANTAGIYLLFSQQNCNEQYIHICYLPCSFVPKEQTEIVVNKKLSDI